MIDAPLRLYLYGLLGAFFDFQFNFSFSGENLKSVETEMRKTEKIESVERLYFM